MKLPSWPWITIISSCCLLFHLTHSWMSPLPLATLRPHGQYTKHSTKKREKRRCWLVLHCCSSMSTVIGLESTPNPSSFLVKLSAPLVGLEELTGTLQGRTYSTVTESTPKKIAEILTIDGIDLVYCMATALTVNKKAAAKWDFVLPLVIAALGVEKDRQVVLLQGYYLLLATLLQSVAAATGNMQDRCASECKFRTTFPFKLKQLDSSEQQNE